MMVERAARPCPRQTAPAVAAGASQQHQRHLDQGDRPVQPARRSGPGPGARPARPRTCLAEHVDPDQRHPEQDQPDEPGAHREGLPPPRGRQPLIHEHRPRAQATAWVRLRIEVTRQTAAIDGDGRTAQAPAAVGGRRRGAVPGSGRRWRRPPRTPPPPRGEDHDPAERPERRHPALGVEGHPTDARPPGRRRSRTARRWADRRPGGPAMWPGAGPSGGRTARIGQPTQRGHRRSRRPRRPAGPSDPGSDARPRLVITAPWASTRPSSSI